MAIVWHDVVYNFGKDGNEEKSAELMMKEEGAVGCSVREAVKRLTIMDTARLIILSTKDHVPLHKQARDVIDLDLYNLSDTALYVETGKKVAEEYSHLSREDWRNGRIKWLVHMLKKPQIYYGFMRPAEKDARENLLYELNRKWRVYEPAIAVPNEDGVVRSDT